MKETFTYSIIGSVAIAAGIYLLLRKRNDTTSEEQLNTIIKDTTLPRGYRNNNPLNIRINSANNWLGKVIPNTDGAFEQFQNMAYGYRAALQLIRTYINGGYNTVSAIISRWAPANENNTARYIERVCNTTGYSANTVINAYNKEQMCKLVYAMAIVENGSVPGHPNYSIIELGYNLL